MIFRSLYFHLFASQIMLPLALPTPAANNLLLFYLLAIANVCLVVWSLVCGTPLLPPHSPVNIVLQFNYFSFSCFVFFNRRRRCLAQAATATTTELTCMQHPPPLIALHKAHETHTQKRVRERRREREQSLQTLLLSVSMLQWALSRSRSLVYLRSRAAQTVPIRCEWLGTVNRIKHL